MTEGVVDTEKPPVSFREYAKKKGLDPASIRKSLETPHREGDFSLMEEETRQVKENQSWVEKIFARLRKERETSQPKVETPAPTIPATQEKPVEPPPVVSGQEAPVPAKIEAVTEPTPEPEGTKPLWLKKQAPIVAERARAHGVGTGPLIPTPSYKEQVAARALEQFKGSAPPPTESPAPPPPPEPTVQPPKPGKEEEKPLEKLSFQSILKGKTQ